MTWATHAVPRLSVIGRKLCSQCHSSTVYLYTCRWLIQVERTALSFTDSYDAGIFASLGKEYRKLRRQREFRSLYSLVWGLAQFWT